MIKLSWCFYQKSCLKKELFKNVNDCCRDIETHDLLIFTNPDAELKVLKDNV